MASRIMRVGNKLYDTKTPNKSFLQVAKDLRSLGVKEWYFMLEIKDPSLVNIDPYAVNKDGHTTCTKDQIARITTEIYNNPWYYLREIARIPTSGGDGSPYIANRGNIAQAWCLLQGIDSWLNLPRQQGKTKSALSIQNWAYSWGTKYSTFIFINKDGENAKQNLRDFSTMIDLLPEYLRYESITTDEGKVVKGTHNATRLQHPITENQVIVKSKATSVEDAINKARGLTAPILHFDEVEFTPYIDLIVQNSVSTFETASRKSEENGTIYGRIFTSTPGDPDTDSGRRAELLYNQTMPWKDEYYNLSKDEIIETCRKNKKMPILYIEYSYRQIGLSDEWFRNIAEKIGDKTTIRREILLQRLRGSSESPYDRDDVEYIIDMAKKPIKTVMLNKYYQLDIYSELNRSIPYIVGIDCSTGKLKDANAMTVIDPYTLKPVAEFECNYVGEPDYERCIIDLVKNHIPRAILCIERNHVGDAIIQHLLETPIAGRIYYDKYKDIAEKSMEKLETDEEKLRARARLGIYYGVFTEGQSRDKMFTILANRIKNNKDDFVTQKIARDISKLVRKGVKILAVEPNHDDNIMSYLIALYVFFYGNNLPVFGFDPADTFLFTEKNIGLEAPDFDNMDLFDMYDDVKEFVQMEQQRHAVKSNEDILRELVARSQQQSEVLAKKGLIEGSAYNNMPQQDLEGYYEDVDQNEAMDFFDEINSW